MPREWEEKLIKEIENMDWWRVPGYMYNLDDDSHTKSVCLAAVNKNPYSIEYVKNQAPEICLAAVAQDGYSIEYVPKELLTGQLPRPVKGRGL